MDERLIFWQKQRQILPIINSEAGKFLIGSLGAKVDFPIIGITPNSFIEDTGERVKNTRILRATFFSKRPFSEIFLPPLEKLAILKEDRDIENDYDAFLFYANLQNSRKYPHILLTTTTFNPVAGSVSPVDGMVRRAGVNETFSTIRAGAGNGAFPTLANDAGCTISASSTSNQFSEIRRGIFCFDTHTITAANVISAATFSLFFTAASSTLGQSTAICAVTPTSTSNIVTGDYAVANYGSTRFATDVAKSGVSTSVYTDFALNASGLAYINATGVTSLGNRDSGDFDSSAPAWSSGATDNGCTHRFADDGVNIPKLTVTYAAPVAGGAFLNNFI